MKSFSCGEVVPDCPAVFSGQAYEDLLNQVAERAERDHSISRLPPQVAEAVAVVWRQSDAPT